MFTEIFYTAKAIINGKRRNVAKTVKPDFYCAGKEKPVIVYWRDDSHEDLTTHFQYTFSTDFYNFDENIIFEHDSMGEPAKLSFMLGLTLNVDASLIQLIQIK